MDNLSEINKFVEEAEKFKQTETYQSMPIDKRDFFNEELGRFKLILEMNFLCQEGQKKNSEK